MKYLKIPMLGLLFSLLVILRSEVKAQTGTPTPTPVATELGCTIGIYQSNATSLPLGMEQSYIETGKSLNPSYRYAYVLTITSLSAPDTIRSVVVTSAAGIHEPIDILQVKSIDGSCSIGSDKSLNCTLAKVVQSPTSGIVTILASPHYDSNYPYNSLMFSVVTDKGTTTCLTHNPITAPSSPSASPVAQIPGPNNVRVKGYRTVTGTEYKEAVIQWDVVNKALRYEIVRLPLTDYYWGVGSTSDTQYILRFKSDTTWDIAVYSQDIHYVRGGLSNSITIAYPGVDSLPAVPNYYGTPIPTPVSQTPAANTPRPTPQPVVFDSTKIAVLEQKISDLEKNQQEQGARINILEAVVNRIREIFSRLFK